LLAAVPLWWPSRAARFSLVYLAVTWLAMALTRDAGGSAHHVILMWPFPLLFAGVTLSGLRERFRSRVASAVAAAVGVALVAMNLSVVNQYIAQFERNGPAEIFTDAIGPLSDRLTAFGDRPIYVIDWGMANVLEFLHSGQLNLLATADPLMTDTPSEIQQRILRAMFDHGDAVYVSHVAAEEIFPMVNERLDRAAAAAGLVKEPLETVLDSNGRPRFDLFVLAPKSNR
jgi:hypothetical protein